jgi:hypothetical protein
MPIKNRLIAAVSPAIKYCNGCGGAIVFDEV